MAATAATDRGSSRRICSFWQQRQHQQGAVPGVVSAVAIPATEGYSTYKTITSTKAAVDLTLAVSDKKTTNDIVLSSVTGKNCKIQNRFTTGKICKNK